MATGTSKTFTAFQIVWKLKKSGWLRKPVLFIADRKVLRDQAYNTFAPFVDSQSDPRISSEVDGSIPIATSILRSTKRSMLKTTVSHSLSAFPLTSLV
jgi:type I site-specific restriction endonuclease